MVKLASQFVALPPERRALAFGQTAARMSASGVVVEKDFWVCWLLGLLFGDAELAPNLVFKGGTSLSKVYGVIDRFSEDVRVRGSHLAAAVRRGHSRVNGQRRCDRDRGRAIRLRPW